MPIWTLFVWIIIGLIAGFVASNLMGRPGRFGLVGDLVVGLVGAVLGGWIVGLLGGGATGGIIGSIVVAILGSMLLIYLLRMFGASRV